MKSKIIKLTTDKIYSLEKRLLELKQLLPKIENTDFKHAKFEILVISMWRNEGEPNSKTEFEGTLNNAVKQAVSDFRTKNNRNDWQAYISYITLKIDGEEIPLPKKYWEKLEVKHSK